MSGLKSCPSDKSITSLEISSSEFSALVSLYDSTNGPKWRNSKNWIIDKKSLFRWQGVETHESGRVSKLRLLMNELSGTIPDCVSALNEIVYLDMSNNKLVNTIPTSISKLTKLKDLKLHYNQLSGSIPESIGSLTSLRGLHLESNQFSGIIPQSIRFLTALTKLNLGLSQLSGPIPECILELTSLQELKLNNNRLSGEIPRGIDRLTALKVLCLHDNKLTGEIPPELGAMPSLRKLHLNNNRLTGRLPLTFRAHCHNAGGHAAALHQLNLKVENNQLVGPLTIEELGRTGTFKKLLIGAAWLCLAMCVYIVIPLLLPFTVGVCLHNHVQFTYSPSHSPLPVGPVSVVPGGHPQSTYKGLTMDQVNEQSLASHAGEQTQEESAVTCRIPAYCRAVYLQWAFPLVAYRSITLGEVEVGALFRAVVDNEGGAYSGRAVQFHVITVTPAIAQIVAEAVTSGSAGLSSVSISAIESVLAPPVREILLAAVRAHNSHAGFSGSPLRVFYNRHDLSAEKVTLHIAGLGYLTEFIVKLRPLGGALQGLFDMENQQGVENVKSREPLTAASAFRWLSDLVECSLQFDLSHHPKCVRSWGGRQTLSGSSASKRSVRPSAGGRSPLLSVFLTEQCLLSTQVAEQLQNVLGVESTADLALLEPRDLSEVLRLPLIPQRKLVRCVCDVSMLPLGGAESGVEDRPLCGGGADKIATSGLILATSAAVADVVTDQSSTSLRGVGEEITAGGRGGEL